MAWSIVLDSLVFSTEAEIRWLDHCEARLRRAAERAASAQPQTRFPHAPTDARGGRPVNAVLHLDRVSRIHGEGETEVHALRTVSFRAHAGELVAVMGPSGSGKSTLLTLAGGLDQPTPRPGLVEGEDLGSLGNAGRPGCGGPRSATSSRTST